MRIPSSLPILLAACAFSAACGDNDDDRAIEVAFRAVVGDQPAACGTTYAGIGTTQSTLSLRELKMYVSDVSVLYRDGHEHELELDQDGVWQRDAVALLDFENATGDCSQGTAETNLSLRGLAHGGDITGVRFTVGLPPEMNHLDAATAPAPLNAPGMWWSWKGGYKFLRLDARTRGNPAYFLHLGSAACDGDSSAGYTCSKGNAPRVTVSGIDLDRQAVVLDLAKLWGEVDLDRQIDMRTDFVQGCMAGPTDPECPAVFARLGLSAEGTGGELQSVFAAGAR